MPLDRAGIRVVGGLRPRLGQVPGLACALLLMGCASAQVARLPKAGAETACITPAAQQDVVVGVSFSGGGSRAALFGASGLEAVGRLRAPQGGSVLEQVSYVSSVSGGGLAAGYYALHKPARETPVPSRKTSSTG